MSTAKNEKCKGKHFTRSKPMSHMLLEILVDEALKGNKPSSTFKAESFVKAHPNHDKYLNKNLDMYEAMTIVVEKDMATGNYIKSFADINLEENIEVQSISIENEAEYEETSKGKETSSSSTQKRQHKKRNQMYEDDSVEKLPKKIGDVAFAIQSLSKNQLDVNEIYT
ncbi:hypothetical protein POPTR_005G130601v4 [Populus trichocarpa]|uniref:Uncharacterized protein n=1 Tax=Populus trichocarpa TaxID=3694 RepID=A0ACC0SZK4_POPTR|nr:uncharacterized protein LOC18099352 [Populus trichocarpa]KAI9394704.1 hypothetical protein POPTR_005G130601v4 [Populus trichocarpa]